MLDYFKKKRGINGNQFYCKFSVSGDERKRRREKPVGVREECFILVVVIVITKKTVDRSAAAFTIVGSWLVESEGEQLVTMDERSE